MGTITINVDDDMEKRFRITVTKEKGLGKGKLGNAVEEALDLWVKSKEQREITQRQLELMNRGFHLGKYVFNRDELHEQKH